MTVRGRSADELLRLWESGVPLDSAWSKFALSLDEFALSTLHTHPNDDPKIFGLGDHRYKELSKGWLPRTWEGRQKKFALITKKERLHLLREINAGYLWAIGSRMLASGSDELVVIPRELFLFEATSDPKHRPEINWDASELRASNTSYALPR
jgi:hypothetical protein